LAKIQGIYVIAPSLLNQRFALRETQYLCERFDVSPNISEERFAADHLTVRYSCTDVPIVPALCKVFAQMYLWVKDWFGFRGDIAQELWVAPSVEDLQFMTCMPCGEGYACAPGTKNGADIIVIDSPSLGGKNSDEGRLSAVLAHEISHHFISAISRCTPFTMKRKENLDVPMWLEEGLATVVMSEVYPSLRTKFEERISLSTAWYPLVDMYDDLSSCDEPDKAYLQAYKETKALIDCNGKAKIVKLLFLNRTHEIGWNELPYGGEVSRSAKYANSRRV
jgi:hypothetical protein